MIVLISFWIRNYTVTFFAEISQAPILNWEIDCANRSPSCWEPRKRNALPICERLQSHETISSTVITLFHFVISLSTVSSLLSFFLVLRLKIINPFHFSIIEVLFYDNMVFMAQTLKELSSDRRVVRSSLTESIS